MNACRAYPRKAPYLLYTPLCSILISLVFVLVTLWYTAQSLPYLLALFAYTIATVALTGLVVLTHGATSYIVLCALLLSSIAILLTQPKGSALPTHVRIFQFLPLLSNLLLIANDAYSLNSTVSPTILAVFTLLLMLWPVITRQPPITSAAPAQDSFTPPCETDRDFRRNFCLFGTTPIGRLSPHDSLTTFILAL